MTDQYRQSGFRRARQPRRGWRWYRVTSRRPPAGAVDLFDGARPRRRRSKQGAGHPGLERPRFAAVLAAMVAAHEAACFSSAPPNEHGPPCIAPSSSASFDLTGTSFSRDVAPPASVTASGKHAFLVEQLLNKQAFPPCRNTAKAPSSPTARGAVPTVGSAVASPELEAAVPQASQRTKKPLLIRTCRA